MKKIICNRIITPDGTMIKSRHRHDYVSYTDANGETYVVDGGNDYLRRSQNKEPATEASVYSTDKHELIREVIEWGTRGKNGDEPLHYVTLTQMTSEHIEAILETQNHISPELRKIFEQELRYRNRMMRKKNA
jgi:hypothetical protein